MANGEMNVVKEEEGAGRPAGCKVGSAQDCFYTRDVSSTNSPCLKCRSLWQLQGRPKG